jgi:hypothetical protein
MDHGIHGGLALMQIQCIHGMDPGIVASSGIVSISYESATIVLLFLKIADQSCCSLLLVTVAS